VRIVHVLAAATVALGASPAAAAITTVVLTGVASGSDSGYLTAPSPFGIPQLTVDVSTGATSGLVFEQAFTLTLSIDDSVGTVDSFPNGDSIAGLGVLTATFSMNGFAYDFGNVDSLAAKGFGGPSQIYGGASESRLRPPMTGDFTNVWGALDFNIHTLSDIFQERRFGEPAAWTRGPGDIAEGNVTLSLQGTSGTELAHVLGPIRTADLDLRIDTLSITAVPEPATWGLMIAGFGLTGATLRRRRMVLAAIRA
jgi:hypothetical protein